ncbi:unnamed protein product, partial [Mesorhabditis spiculigera]
MRFLDEMEIKAREYEKSVTEMVDGLHTLPRIHDFTTDDALYGGATVYADVADWSVFPMMFIDFLMIMLIWTILLLVNRDYIHVFFGLLNSLFSAHLFCQFTYTVLFMFMGWNATNFLYLTFILNRTVTLFLGTGSVALILIGLATHLNRRPPRKFEWKIYLPLLAMSALFSFALLQEVPRRFWHWMAVCFEIFALIFASNILFLTILLAPCRKDAKSNLVGLFFYQIFVVSALLTADVASISAVAAISKFTEVAQCTLSKAPALQFPCGDIFFLVDNSYFIRPFTVYLPAILFLPSLRKNLPWRIWGKPAEPEVPEEVLRKRTDHRVPSETMSE